MRSSLGAGAAVVLTLASAHAHAQVGPPPVRWIGAPSDASGSAGRAAPSSQAILFEPLRLGLLGDIAPMSAGEPGCADRVEAAGNATASSSGAPMQALAARALAPRLTLFGLSRAGCPVDAGIGAGLVYVVPLRPSVFFVAGFGTLVQPRYGERPAIVHTQARADLVFDRGQGRSWNVGLRTTARTAGVSFGGIF